MRTRFEVAGLSWQAVIRRYSAASLAALLCLLLLPVLASAHTVRPAVVTLTLQQDSTYSLDIRLSAEWLLAGIDPRYSDTNDAPNASEYDELRALPPEDLAARFDAFAGEFMGRLQLEFDGVRAEPTYVGIDVPPVGDLDLARDATIRLQGQVPADATELGWAWPAQYGNNVLRILRSDAPDDAYSVWLRQGERSANYSLQDSSPRRAGLSVLLDYLIIGVEHIVPKGLDHILFVLGIFLLSTRLVPLLWQVTAFTLAHTITLGLSIYGVIALPESVVEPLIALSIAYVGIENALRPTLTPWRVVLVFAFGLLHGMGFAGVLSEIGLPRGDFLGALIAFNVGVEIGQLLVIAGAFLLLGWWRHAPWYRSRVVIPLSLLIAMVGLYWTWERVWG